MWEAIDNVGVIGTQSNIDWYKQNLPWVESALGERIGDNNGDATYIRFFNPTDNTHQSRAINPLKKHPLYSSPGWVRGQTRYNYDYEGPTNKHKTRLSSPPVIDMSSPDHKWYDGLDPRQILLHEAAHRKQVDPNGWAQVSKPVVESLSKDPVYNQYVDYFADSHLPNLYGRQLSDPERDGLTNYMKDDHEAFAFGLEQYRKQPMFRNIGIDTIKAYDNMFSEIQKGRP